MQAANVTQHNTITIAKTAMIFLFISISPLILLFYGYIRYIRNNDCS